MITKHIFIGGFGEETSSINPVYSTIPDYQDFKIETEMGGVWIGYIFRIKPFYFTISGKSAWGDLTLINPETKQTLYDDIAVLTRSFEIQKTIDAGMRITASVGVFYNFYRNVDLLTYTNKDMYSPGISFGMKFGMF